MRKSKENSINQNREEKEENSIQKILIDLLSSKRDTPKCELKDRRDVINKSILRAIKKQIAQEFKSFHPYQRFKDLRNKIAHFKTSLTNMAKFYSHLYSASEIYELFGFLVDYEFFSFVQKEEEYEHIEIKRFSEIYSSCWVQYSHSKFENIVTSPYFKILYSIFKSKWFESFLSKHEDISNNKESYKSAIDKIEQKI